MKYTVHDNDLRDFTFAAEAGAVVLQAVDYDFVFTEDQFRDFRKAVGFVWQEVHSDGE